MVVAEVARKSPFDNDGVKSPSRNIALEIAGIAILGFCFLFVRFRVQEDLHFIAHSVIASIYAILILKNITYGTVILVIAIGISPDSVGYNNVRYEDYMFPPLLVIWWFKRSGQNSPLFDSDITKSIKFYMLIVLISTVNGLLQRTIWTQWIAFSFCYSLNKCFK